MEKSKQKHKSTREPQISANSISAKKRAKQDVVRGMVVTSLEIKTRGYPMFVGTPVVEVVLKLRKYYFCRNF